MPESEQVAFSYRPDRSLWNTWKVTVQREKALHDRLDELLELDAEHDLDDLVYQAEHDGRTRRVDELVDAIQQADPEEDNVRLEAMRIRRRCMTALPAAREAGADTAAEELAEIQQIANDLLDLDE